MISQHERFTQKKPQVMFKVEDNRFHQGSLNSNSINSSNLDRINLNRSSLNRSSQLRPHLVQDSFKYVKYDQQGNTSLVSEPKQLEKGFSYKKVIYEQNTSELLGVNIYCKSDITQMNLSQNEKLIVLKPLRRLYERNFRPQFFTFADQTKSIAFKFYNEQVPGCLYEMDHLSLSHIKSLFITQDYAEDGVYEIIVNQEGRFKVIRINDSVPVYAQTNQHIWAVEQPWKILLLKAWASLKGGYMNVITQSTPFKFIQTFTSNNWKYYNLQRQKHRFIDLFKNKMDLCYIVLQTRNSSQVKKMGLTPDSCAFNIVQFNQMYNQGEKNSSTIEVKTRFKHKWQGRLNLVKSLEKLNFSQVKTFRLEKNLVLTENQFFDMFSCAYVTSLSKSNTHITNFTRIQVPTMTKNAIYLKFTIQTQGFMDFSFIQPNGNKKSMKNQNSYIDHQRYQNEVGKGASFNRNRFLKCKYMLIKKINANNSKFQSKLSKIKRTKQHTLTSQARYEAYEVQYLRGYNKGEAHYMLMQPGDYYLRIKSQTSQNDAVYFLNYCSSQKIQINTAELHEQEKQEIMQNCILSLLPAARIYRTKNARLYSGDTFESMGYGYIVCKNLTANNKSQGCIVLMEIDFQELQKEGYRIKGRKHQSNQNQLAFKVDPQKYLVLIFKKIQDQIERKYNWPPNGLSLFRSKDLEAQI